LKLVPFCVNVGEQYPTNLSSAWDGRAALFGALPMDMPNFCGAVWHLLNDSCLDVVGFLFGAGAGFFFAAALAASALSFKLNLPLESIRHGEYDINSTTSKASNFRNVPLTHSSTSLVFDDFGRGTLPPRIPTCPNEARRDFAVKLRVSGVFRGIAQSICRE